jgi:hypothetical protein
VEANVSLAYRAPNETKQKIAKQTVDVVAAKVGASADPVMTSSASLIASVEKEDAVQASADALKLSAEALAKAKSASPVLNGVSSVASAITSANKAKQGEAYSAASAASAAIEKASPALANSTVGAIANVAVLATAQGQKQSQAAAVKESAQKVMSAGTPKQRLKATFDLTAAVQGLVNLYRSVGNAAWKLGTFGLARAAKVASLAPAATKAQAGVAKLATSPVGKLAGFANKWLPFLNIAGVALSAKHAINVFQKGDASTTSKTLSVASVGMALGSLVAGFTLKGLAFVGVIAAGVATDVALAHALGADAKGLDTDARARHILTHPGQSAVGLIGWGKRAIPEFFGAIKNKLVAGGERVKAAF